MVRDRPYVAVSRTGFSRGSFGRPAPANQRGPSAKREGRIRPSGGPGSSLCHRESYGFQSRLVRSTRPSESRGPSAKREGRTPEVLSRRRARRRLTLNRLLRLCAAGGAGASPPQENSPPKRSLCARRIEATLTDMPTVGPQREARGENARGPLAPHGAAAPHAQPDTQTVRRWGCGGFAPARKQPTKMQPMRAPNRSDPHGHADGGAPARSARGNARGPLAPQGAAAPHAQPDTQTVRRWGCGGFAPARKESVNPAVARQLLHQIADDDLGVAEEHVGLVVEVEAVVDAGEAGVA